MKVLVAIPSYNRPYDIEKRCGYWLKQLKDIDWRVFVRPDQYMYYSQVIPEKHLVEIDVTSYRETINAIGSYAVQNGYDLVHRVDDDMSFKMLGKAKKEHSVMVYETLYKEIVEKFKSDPDLYGVSVSKPMHHIRNKETKWTRQNKALYGNQWLRPEILYLPTGIELFDDIYMTLLILDMGKKTLTYSGAYEDAVVLKNSGGLQSINRNELSRKTISCMSIIFPDVKEGNYKDQENVVDIDLKALNIK